MFIARYSKLQLNGDGGRKVTKRNNSAFYSTSTRRMLPDIWLSDMETAAWLLSTRDGFFPEDVASKYVTAIV